jgi:hypothetical protein
LYLQLAVSHEWNLERKFHFLTTLDLIHEFILFCSFLSRAYLQEDLTDPRNSSLFLRLAHSPQASILIRPPLSRSEDYLVASKISSKEQFLAVAGALVGKETLLSIWRNAIEAFNVSDHMHLYWLDEGGYVIASNQINISPGSFIGSKNVDPQVSWHIYMVSYFR